MTAFPKLYKLTLTDNPEANFWFKDDVTLRLSLQITYSKIGNPTYKNNRVLLNGKIIGHIDHLLPADIIKEPTHL